MKKLWIDLRRMIITIVLIVLLCLFGFDDIFNLFNEHIEAFIGFIFIVDILIHAIYFVYIYHFDEYKISCRNNPFFKKTLTYQGIGCIRIVKGKLGTKLVLTKRYIGLHTNYLFKRVHSYDEMWFICNERLVQYLLDVLPSKQKQMLIEECKRTGFVY